MDGTQWVPATEYFLPLSAQTALDITDLTLDAWLDGEERSVDLVPYLHENMWYVDLERGFTLHVPQAWAGQVSIQESDASVDFYMKNAGDFEGAGWLVSIYWTDPASWKETADAGYPRGERFLGQSTQGVLFAAGPTDVPCDVSIPGAAERYGALCEQVEELLDSFQLDSAYALAQSWVEEQVAKGAPEWAQGYDYLDGRIQSLKLQSSVMGYTVYEMEYRFLVDHPENVVVAGGMELDEEGWLRDYSMVAYLIVRDGNIEGVTLSDIAPDSPLFWYELPDLSEEEKWQAVAQVAYAGGEEYVRLYQGYGTWSTERTFTREELTQAGYQVQTMPEKWKKIAWNSGSGPSDQNWLRGEMQFYFSDSLAGQMIDTMFTGPDAPFLFYDGELYFRDDVPCGEKIDGMGFGWSWNTFTITDHVEDVGVDGIDFTISNNDAASGVEATETWSFRLIREEDYSIRFHRWFDLQ